MKRNLFLSGLVLLSLTFNQNAFARADLSEQFAQNSAIIYTLNIRNFGSVDKDKDGIIDESKGDIKGTFLNASEKLKDLKKEGINTIYLLPITKTGKLKALGNAGSLYAMDAFDEINPYLDDNKNEISVYEEARFFVDSAHKLDMNVILDLPSCGSYDLSLKKPSWFLFDNKNEAQIPADWTDVRLFKVYNDDNKTLNIETLNNFKSFIDMALNLGFDGIRADVAAIKPYEFWENIIDYAKNKNEKFIFIAEASPDWSNPANGIIEHYTTIDELLDAGFDGYYGSWSDFKNIKTKKEFDEKIEKNLKILSKHNSKAMIAAFATHDQQAPVLRGKNYHNMILWLSTTLPLNSYFLDGFSVGDDFIYDYENKKASYSLTDDEYYFVHSGSFDIFNTTGPVREKNISLKKNYINAINFKLSNIDLFKYGKYKTLKTKNDRVFAYSMTYLNKELVVVGNLDENNNQKACVNAQYLKKKNLFQIIFAKEKPQIIKNKIEVNLEPLEIQVYLINQVSPQES